MSKDILISNFEETELIDIIEKIVSKNLEKNIIRDDSFYYSLDRIKERYNLEETVSVFNSDMLVSTTDIPIQMSYFQVGRKSVIMNISDLFVKGVRPVGIIISLGLPKELKLIEFKELINGIVEQCKSYDLDYIGGDINETRELIINPTVFGFQEELKIIHREGAKPGDFLVVNGKFGLTGVGFDILIEKEGLISDFTSYKRSIQSVLEPSLNEKEALILGEKCLANASIDSSDGLAKSMKELIRANPGIGIEIEFDSSLIDEESIRYSKNQNIPIAPLVLNGGEEFIHIFTISPQNFESARSEIEGAGGKIFKIGTVISEENIYLRINDERIKMNYKGYEHFSKNK